ncbi:MAG: pseudouridine synthase [Candidatus Dadabacteria bacterium]
MLAHRYFIINKPYGMESQFTGPPDTVLLSGLGYLFPAGIHAIGRLDKYSEGLLLLTTNKKVTSLLFAPGEIHKRVYLVQLKHIISEEKIQHLSSGVAISSRGGGYYTTQPCEVHRVEPPLDLPLLPVQVYSKIPTCWLQITLTEGKFHQVRKMIKGMHHRCMRLVRIAIEDLTLGDLQPGGVKEMDEESFFRLLHLREYPVNNG